PQPPGDRGAAGRGRSTRAAEAALAARLLNTPRAPAPSDRVSQLGTPVPAAGTATPPGDAARPVYVSPNGTAWVPIPTDRPVAPPPAREGTPGTAVFD